MGPDVQRLIVQVEQRLNIQINLRLKISYHNPYLKKDRNWIVITTLPHLIKMSNIWKISLVLAIFPTFSRAPLYLPFSL